MTTEASRTTNNIVLGNGEIYIDLIDDDGNFEGERYLGDSIGATLSVTTERTTIQSGDGEVASDLVDVVRSVQRTLSFTLRDSSIANWRLFIVGEEAAGRAARSGDGSAVTDESHGAVKAGRAVTLGYPKGVGSPMGVGAVKSKLTAKDDATAISPGNIETAAADVDSNSMLLVDLALGRVTALQDIGELKVSYTPAGGVPATRQARATGDPAQITCALRYVEDAPSAGKGRNVYARKCNLVPGGEAALKSRDTEQQLAFTATIMDPGGTLAAVVIDGAEA